MKYVKKYSIYVRKNIYYIKKQNITRAKRFVTVDLKLILV